MDEKDQKNTSQEPQAELSELMKITAQRDEYLNGWKRSQADFINYKKDEIRRSDQLRDFLVSDVVLDLLPILDSFDIGMAATPPESPAYKGMGMIRGQLQEVLKRKGVERIAVAKGDVFDPVVHEAMMEVEEKDLVGKIIEEIAPGYRMSGRVIRASKVKVGR